MRTLFRVVYKNIKVSRVFKFDEILEAHLIWIEAQIWTYMPKIALIDTFLSASDKRDQH